MSLASKLLLSGFLVLVSQAAGGRPYDVLISEVVSGDTIKTSTGETIRIYGVSCPERMQDLASEATDFTKKLVIYKTVTVNPKKKGVWGPTIA